MLTRGATVADQAGSQNRWFVCTNCGLMVYGPDTGRCIAERSGEIIGHNPDAYTEFTLPYIDDWIE